MNKRAQAMAVELFNDVNQHACDAAKKLELKMQIEETIRAQLADFAREFEQLKLLHKSN